MVGEAVDYGLPLAVAERGGGRRQRGGEAGQAAAGAAGHRVWQQVWAEYRCEVGSQHLLVDCNSGVVFSWMVAQIRLFLLLQAVEQHRSVPT